MKLSTNFKRAGAVLGEGVSFNRTKRGEGTDFVRGSVTRVCRLRRLCRGRSRVPCPCRAVVRVAAAVVGRRRSWAPEQGRERECVQRCVSEAFFLLAVRGLVRVWVRGSGERSSRVVAVVVSLSPSPTRSHGEHRRALASSQG